MFEYGHFAELWRSEWVVTASEAFDHFWVDVNWGGRKDDDTYPGFAPVYTEVLDTREKALARLAELTPDEIAAIVELSPEAQQYRDYYKEDTND